MEGLCFKEDYDKVFDVETYLSSNFSKENIHQGVTQDGYLLKLLHQIFSVIKSQPGARLLDFGTGPSLYTTFSASTAFDDITLAEYAEQNRAELERWINKHSKAFDWSAVLSIVSGLEGKRWRDPDQSQNLLESKASETEARTRSAIKKVIPCDVTNEDVLLGHTGLPYDFILSVLCLEASCASTDIHREAIAKLCRLLKKGGGLFLSGVLGESFYMVGDHKFFALTITEEYLRGTLKSCGLKVELFETISFERERYGDLSDCHGMYYIHATKK